MALRSSSLVVIRSTPVPTNAVCGGQGRSTRGSLSEGPESTQLIHYSLRSDLCGNLRTYFEFEVGGKPMDVVSELVMRNKPLKHTLTAVMHFHMHHRSCTDAS